MLDAATNKLLHGPVTRLRALAGDPRAEDYLDALHDLFEVSVYDGAPGLDPRPKRHSTGMPPAEPLYDGAASEAAISERRVTAGPVEAAAVATARRRL
jgi:hypothetical protein